MDAPLFDVLALIPARGGSKGVPRKNIRLLGGRPLIHYACEAAARSRWVTRTIVSTDDPQLARVARAGGAETPFLRPAELARDETPTLPVVRHALAWLAQHERWRPDIVVLLQPTAPLRRARHVDEALELLADSGCDAVVSVAPVPAHFHADWQLVLAGGVLRLANGRPLAAIKPRRQSLPPTYWRNGAIYAVRRTALERTGSLYGRRCAAYVMPLEDSINIDTLEDWRRAEEAIRRREELREAG